MNECKYWTYNLKDNTCIGCGNVICPICLQEPSNCRCENKMIAVRYKLKFRKRLIISDILKTH